MKALTWRQLRGKVERVFAPSYSTCYRCERPWKFAKPHSTQITDGRGCFPLCEDCWRELTAEERLPYYELLFYSRRVAGHPEDDKAWNALKANVLSGG